MRTEEWSVTAWSTWDGAALRPIWGSHCGEASPDPEPGNSKVGCYELYSHAGDDGMAPAAFDDYVSTARNPSLGLCPARSSAALPEEPLFQALSSARELSLPLSSSARAERWPCAAAPAGERQPCVGPGPQGEAGGDAGTAAHRGRAVVDAEPARPRRAAVTGPLPLLRGRGQDSTV